MIRSTLAQTEQQDNKEVLIVHNDKKVTVPWAGY
jgi:hypothetical protein